MADNLRYEVKMVVDAFFLGEVRSWIYTHTAAFAVAFPPRRVNNVYFDTLDRQFMIDHIDGVPSRAKIRFRWYGDNWKVTAGQLEIKFKTARLGRKKVYPFLGSLDLTDCTWRDFNQALASGLIGPSPGSIFQLEMLHPSLINHYHREYFLSKDKLIRLTLDYGGIAYEQAFGLKPNLSRPQPSLDTLVIELKAPKSEHQRIAEVLSEFPQRCSANSKYLNALQYSLW